MVNSNCKEGLIIEKSDLSEYLKCTDIIDYDSENIKSLAGIISKDTKSEIELAKNCYEYVRDNTYHSFDINGTHITIKASDVLKYKEGLCYAKSHLLAALLRKLGIPTGFCYQKLILDDEKNPYLIIHGLNALYLKEIDKWIKVDARGNKNGVDAQFSLSEAKLAFPVRKELSEEDINIVFAEPNVKVVSCLKKCSSIEELKKNLPAEL